MLCLRSTDLLPSSAPGPAYYAASTEERQKGYESMKPVRKELQKKLDVMELFLASPLGVSEGWVLVVEADTLELFNQYWTEAGFGKWFTGRRTIMCYGDY